MDLKLEDPNPDQRRWSDACLIAKMIAIDPAGLGGVWVKSQAGPVRDQWLKGLQELIQNQVTITKVPTNADVGALIGELDLLKTLARQTKVYSKGILDHVCAGLLLMPMAERMQSNIAALLTQAFDHKQTFGMIAFDESLLEEDQHLLSRIEERLGFQINLEGLSYRHCEFILDFIDIQSVRNQLKTIEVPNEALEAMMIAAQSFGIDSLRVGLYLARAARVLAALRGGKFLEQGDIQTATRLVFAHRIKRLPQSKDDQPDQSPPEEESLAAENDTPPENQNMSNEDPSTPPEKNQEKDTRTSALNREDLEEMIIEATKATLSQNLLDSFSKNQNLIKTNQSSQGKVGQLQKGLLSGQAMPSRKGRPSYEQKVDILKTIQAASPWQKIRQLENPHHLTQKGIIVKLEDIYLKQYVQRTTTVTVFVVDASGSSAMERLSEAKGAVELLLAQCYIRRDQVALMTFRGKDVELVLPPTRSLVRAKRLLAGMPGGGGTPLARAIQGAAQFGKKLKSKGQTPLLVLLTDGRANVSLDGVGGREQAFSDALSTAKKARTEQLQILFIDTSMRPQETNQTIANELGAHYLPLPQGKAANVVQAAKILITY